MLPLTRFGEFELANAIRAAVIRRGIAILEAEHTLDSIKQDAANGRLARTQCDMDQAFQVAASLSREHTYEGGYRALDILHVAIAVVLGCTEFLTFDQRQAQLVRQRGLTALP